MSHVTKVQTTIRDLIALKRACERLGLEFVEGQQEHRYFANKREPCDHAIRCSNPEAYEVGVIKGADGNYALSYDAFAGGKGMMAHISHTGRDAGKLLQHYAVEVAKKQLRKAGYRFTEKVVDGQIHLTTCS